MNILVIGGNDNGENLKSDKLSSFESSQTWNDLSSTVYWFERLNRGGELLGPGNPMTTLQIVDSEDVSSSGPTATVQQILEELRAVCASKATFTWISDSFLRSQGVTDPQIPLWFPTDGLSATETEPVKTTSRPLSEILSASYELYRQQPNRSAESQFLSYSREQEILARWHQLSVPYRSDAMALD